MTQLRVHATRRPAGALIDAFRGAQTADIANALGSSCIADRALRPAWTFDRLVGTALTVRLTSGDNFGAVVAPLFAERGDVLVIDTAGGDTAVVGALIARASAERGVVGAVVDGAVRDVADLERLRFAVVARSISPIRSTKSQDAELGASIHCGGVLVRSGDIVVADRDGVAFVAADRAHEALVAVAREQEVEREASDIRVLMDRFKTVLGSATVVRS